MDKDLVEIVDTAIKIGLGATIGLVTTLLVQRFRHAHEKTMEERNQRNERQIKPIVDYINEWLLFAEKAFDYEQGHHAEKFSKGGIEARFKEAMISAKVLSLKDPELLVLYKKFIEKSFDFDQVVRSGEEKGDRLSPLLEELTYLAGDVIERLYL